MPAAPKVDITGSPLQAANLKLINQALYLASDAVNWMDKAEAAGIDMANERIAHQEAVAKLTAIKQTYFPGAT